MHQHPRFNEYIQIVAETPLIDNRIHKRFTTIYPMHLTNSSPHTN